MPQLSRGRAGSEGRPKRVGHKGADALVHGNTAASFDAALEAGVDMIEFDVLPEHLDGSGGLILAHDYGDASERVPATLDEGLAHLAGPDYAGVELDVDLKLPGYEERVVAALLTPDRKSLQTRFALGEGNATWGAAFRFELAGLAVRWHLLLLLLPLQLLLQPHLLLMRGLQGSVRLLPGVSSDS